MQKNTMTAGILAVAVMSVVSYELAAAAPSEQRAERNEVRKEQRTETRDMLDEQKAERVELRQETRAEVAENRQEQKEERVEMREENKEERMEMRKEGRMGATEKRAERFAAQYARATEKLSNVITRLTDAGVDTTAIAAMVDVLDEKAAAVATAYTAYEEAQGGDDKDAIAAARTELTTARDDFRSYYSGTLRPAIAAAVETVLASDDDVEETE